MANGIMSSRRFAALASVAVLLTILCVAEASRDEAAPRRLLGRGGGGSRGSDDGDRPLPGGTSGTRTDDSGRGPNRTDDSSRGTTRTDDSTRGTTRTTRTDNDDGGRPGGGDGSRTRTPTPRSA